MEKARVLIFIYLTFVSVMSLSAMLYFVDLFQQRNLERLQAQITEIQEYEIGGRFTARISEVEDEQKTVEKELREANVLLKTTRDNLKALQKDIEKNEDDLSLTESHIINVKDKNSKNSEDIVEVQGHISVEEREIFFFGNHYDSTYRISNYASQDAERNQYQLISFNNDITRILGEATNNAAHIATYEGGFFEPLEAEANRQINCEKRYKFQSTPYRGKFNDSRRQCQLMGGDLIYKNFGKEGVQYHDEIRDLITANPKEHDYPHYTDRYNGMWFGFTDVDTEGEWISLDGNFKVPLPTNFTTNDAPFEWLQSQPDNAYGQNCLRTWHNLGLSGLDDENCVDSLLNYGLCEFTTNCAKVY